MSRVADPSRITLGLAGGYTAGHVMPLIAVAQAWQRLYPEDRLQCYGSLDGIEAELVTRLGLPFHGLPARPGFGAGPLGRLRAHAEALRGMLRGRRHLRRAEVDLMLCFGGYAAAGAGLAAASLGIPVAVFEANAIPGRTNDLLARIARFKLAAMDEVTIFSRWRDAQVTGLPLRRPGAQATAEEDRVRAPRLLVTGGTFGSAFLNHAAPPLVAALARGGTRLEVLHQAGSGNEEAVEAAYRVAGIEARVVGFDPELPARWFWADVALCTAGAGTLAEAVASGTPALVVPIGAVADGHQEANAAAAAARHGLAWVRETDWREPREAARLAALIAEPRPPRRAAAWQGTETAAGLVRRLRDLHFDLAGGKQAA